MLIVGQSQRAVGSAIKASVWLARGRCCLPGQCPLAGRQGGWLVLALPLCIPASEQGAPNRSAWLLGLEGRHVPPCPLLLSTARQRLLLCPWPARLPSLPLSRRKCRADWSARLPHPRVPPKQLPCGLGRRRAPGRPQARHRSRRAAGLQAAARGERLAMFSLLEFASLADKCRGWHS